MSSANKFESLRPVSSRYFYVFTFLRFSTLTRSFLSLEKRKKKNEEEIKKEEKESRTRDTSKIYNTRSFPPRLKENKEIKKRRVDEKREATMSVKWPEERSQVVTLRLRSNAMREWWRGRKSSIVQRETKDWPVLGRLFAIY